MKKHPHNIMVFDEDLISCKVASLMLERIGCTVHYFTCACDARQAMHDRQFDLVLLDWCKPTVGGASITGLVRSGKAGEHHRHIPIIAVSTDVSCSQRALFISTGVTDYIEKPVNMKVLHEKVGTLLAPVSVNLLQERSA